MIPLTVVVPTHGRTDLFLQTLDSLSRQTLDSFETIVTDDSVRPEDREIIREATARYQNETGRPTSYLFSEPKLGQARNTNQGLRRARGRFVRILHSDDVLAPRALEAEVALMDDPRLNLQVLYHHVEAFRTAPQFDRQPALWLVQPSLLFRSFLHSGTPLPSATVFTREALDAVGGGMREDLDFLCDWEFFARLLVEQYRRNRLIGQLSRGYIGWRVHGDSTTGRLWHRHFLEHEQFMEELRGNPELAEALIGDQGTRDGFFATAVRYRYQRLWTDICNMTPRQAFDGLPRILQCAFSKRSLHERLQPAPWSPRGSRRYRLLVVDRHPVPPRRRWFERRKPSGDPREGWRYAWSAYVAAAVIRWARTHASRTGADDGSPAGAYLVAGHSGPGLVDLGTRVELRPAMGGQPQGGTVIVNTEYNNTTNLWPIRGLLAAASDLLITGLNQNAYAEPVLHQCLKLLRVGTRIEVPLFDNTHLTSFGFKSLLEKLFPGQFAWVDQVRHGSGHHILQYRRRAAGHATYSASHTGWSFGMITTGHRLDQVQRYIDSIERHCDEPYEILIASPVDIGALARRPHVRVLRFTQRDELGWITRKKNLIASRAKYSEILICHDRFWLTPDFIRSFRDWGFSYGLAALRVKLPDGRRGLDWAVVSSQNHVWSSGGLLDYRAYSQYVYNPGGATVIRKAFWEDFPWNENLFWNEHEDVELCRRVQRAGGVITLTASTLIAAEDRWVDANPRIPYCDQNEVLFGRPVGEQRILFLTPSEAA